MSEAKQFIDAIAALVWLGVACLAFRYVWKHTIPNDKEKP